MAIMSDSSIRLKPVIDEPSNPMPSSSAPGSSSRPIANDLSWPKMSVNQSRTNSTLCSSTWASTSPAPVVLSSTVAISESPLRGGPAGASCPGGDLLRFVGLEHGLAFLARADPHRVLDGKHEELPVADRAGACVPEDRLLDHAQVLLFGHDL